MKLRIVDYIANPGGGVRFIVEAVAAVAAFPDAPSIEFVSDGLAFTTYEAAFEGRCPSVVMRRLRPANNPRLTNRWYHSLPGMTILPAVLSGRSRASLLLSWRRLDVPTAAIEGADVVWLPWVHGHRLESGHARVVATYHDTIGVEFPGILPPDIRQQAQRIESAWCTSEATITVTANATASAIERLYGVPRNRFPVIRLSAIHDHPVAGADASHVEDSWQSRPYLLCPANTSVHKNHEVLLEGYAQWRSPIPLVLTGTGTDFFSGPPRTPRAPALRDLAKTLKIDDGRLICLGYVSDSRYLAILKACHALVMPTLAEGGGSFPVGEALHLNIPVLCSDIPIMREAMEVLGAVPLWFDPRNPTDLARGFEALLTNRESMRTALHERSVRWNRGWAAVAEDYRKLFADVACRPQITRLSASSSH